MNNIELADIQTNSNLRAAINKWLKLRFITMQ